jgi:hypothetical protein
VILAGDLSEDHLSASEVKIAAVGDMMAPLRVKSTVTKNGKPEQYYFGFLFNPVKHLIESADIAFVNLETPISESEMNKPRPFVFNASDDLPKALKWSGFKMVSIANNHSLDQNEKGLTETLASVKKAGLIPIGAGLTRTQSLDGHISEIKGTKIGWLAFTGFINGGDSIARKSKSNYINLTARKEDLHAAIESMRPKVDILILSLHWGVEYSNSPEPWQKKMATELHDLGVDVILGHHPHVLQNVQIYQRKKDNKSCLTFYSLGNFVSNQGFDLDYKYRGPAAEKARTRDSLLAEIVIKNKLIARFTLHPLWITNWSGAEEGIQTVVISDEEQRLTTLIKEQSPSPYRSFLQEQKIILRERYNMILKTLKSQRIFGK